MLAHVEDISGAKRKQNLLEHAEDARVSKRLATVQRDVAVDFDIAAEAAREPDRSRVREVFREYELRDPLRRLEEALGDPELAAPAPAAEVKLSARVRAGAPADIARLGGAEAELCARRARRRGARGRAVRRGPAVALRRAADRHGEEVLAGDCEGPEQVVGGAAASAPWSRTTPRRSGSCRPASPTTRCSAPILLEPARRGYPFAELCEERGLASDLEDPLPPRRCCSARSPPGSASRSPSAASRR